MRHYLVQTASAKMPTSCRFGRYRRVAVLEVEAGVTEVAMISTRARGVVRVVATWERCSVGSTERCAYARALTEARALAARLGAGGGERVAYVPDLADLGAEAA